MKIIIIIFLFLSCNTLSNKSNIDNIIDFTAKNIHSKIANTYPSSATKKKIAIVSFINEELGINEESGDRKLFVSKFGFLLANAVHSDFFKPEQYELIERRQIDQLISEIYDLNSGLYEHNDVQKGKFAGANYILLGSIQKRSKTARINVRLVDVETTTVVAATNINIPLTEDVNDMLSEEINGKNAKVKKVANEESIKNISILYCKTDESTNEIIYVPVVESMSLRLNTPVKLFYRNGSEQIGTTKVEYWYSQCRADYESTTPYKIIYKNIPSHWENIQDLGCSKTKDLLYLSTKTIHSTKNELYRFEVSIVFNDKIQARTGCLNVDAN